MTRAYRTLRLVRAIKKAATKDDVVPYYAEAVAIGMMSCDWPTVNGEIMKHWSKRALVDIKRQAWRLVASGLPR